jgi:hypothetical protein
MQKNPPLQLNLLKTLLYAMFSVFITGSVLASEPDTLFRSEEIIKIELRSDFTAIQNDRAENPVAHDGEVIYLTSSGEAKKLSVKITVRGHFRRDPVHCNFPPLYIDFKKSENKNTLFSNQNRLKLVTPCQTEENVIEEYTIYKMYNKVTEFSLKARLVKVQYFDTKRNKKLFEKYSFFIEDKDHAAERNGTREKDKPVTPFDLNVDNLKKLSVFEYIIGNIDWFVSSRKNIILMQPKDTTLAPYGVPYDFDLSGFVNPEYSKPEGVPEDMLRDKRVYRGIRYTEEEFKEIFEFYRKLRPVFESIINNQVLLSKYNKKYLLGYIGHFYTVIENNELIKKEFLDKGQTRKDYNLPEK